MPVFLRDLEATPCCRDASMKDPLRGASNQSAALTHSYRCTFDALKRDKLTRRKTDYMWSVWGRPLSADVRFGSKADMCGAQAHVRFTPESGHLQRIRACPLWAKSGHWGLSKIRGRAARINATSAVCWFVTIERPGWPFFSPAPASRPQG